MSLEFNKLIGEVETLSNSLAQRAAAVNARAPQVAEALSRLGAPQRWWYEKITRAGDRWSGAVPVHEPPGLRKPLPASPPQFTVLGVDGSQIYPDRHGAVQYYVINVGSLVYTHGQAIAPVINSHPHVYYVEESLATEENEGQLSNALIDGQRDVAELQELARLAQEHNTLPTVALLDNGLLFWLAWQMPERRQRQARQLLDEYLAQLEILRQTGIALAGFICRPRSVAVLLLLHLLSMTETQITDDSWRSIPDRGLSDRMVFEHLLAPGERSALFYDNSLLNRSDDFAGHLIHFFYINVGHPGQPEIARVEVPAWVANQPELLDLTQAAIVAQCHVPEGFPYVLVRAHELAVVTLAEKNALDQLVHQALLQRGLVRFVSQKARTKQWTAGKRRHRL